MSKYKKPKRSGKAREGQPATARAEKPKKVRATFHLPAELIEEVRDAVVFLSGPPNRLTLALLAENALRRELGRLKQVHNAGGNFPRREEDLRGGRPIGS